MNPKRTALVCNCMSTYVFIRGLGHEKFDSYTLCLLFNDIGAGVATVVITFWLVTYYIVILSWALYYLIYSFQSDVPWKGCKNSWNRRM